MKCLLKSFALALLGGAALLCPGAAHAQYIVHSAPVVAPAPVVTTYSAPVVAPSFAYSAPAAVTYSYYPATTVYSAPAATVFSAPAAIAVPGTATTRTYRGFGLFRPRGLYTETYVAPR